jgi:hypothetical protein
MKPAVIVLLLALAACNEASSKAPDERALVDLNASTAAARSEFNAHKHEARFLTLLSPT